MLVPPKITPFEFAKDVNVGDRVSVQCVVGTGDLPLTFHWYKDDVALSSGPMNDDKSASKKFTTNVEESSVTIRQNDEFSSALSINSLQPNQGGTYKCVVENDAAKEMYSALLRVNGKIYEWTLTLIIIFSHSFDMFVWHDEICIFSLFCWKKNCPNSILSYIKYSFLCILHEMSSTLE